MKTRPLLWLHTTFEWSALQFLPESTGLCGFRSVKAAENLTSVGLCMHCLLVSALSAGTLVVWDNLVILYAHVL